MACLQPSVLPPLQTTSISTTNPLATQASSEPPSKKRKRHDTHILYTCTFRKPAWSYFHLRLATTSPPTSNSSSPASLDELTTRTLLTPPLQSYLGLTGAAIPIDILKSEGRDVWIRVERQDAKGLQAGLSGWVGSADADMIPFASADEPGRREKVSWRIVRSCGSMASMAGDGSDLFGD